MDDSVRVSHDKINDYLLSGDKELNIEMLHSMGFSAEYIGEQNAESTRIIYPTDYVKDENLSVVIYIPGDGDNNRFRNRYFNNYLEMNGSDLPRAIYVSTGSHKYESASDNAYLDVQNWCDENGINIRQVGVEAFSGGGGAGLMLAELAANDNPDIPVTLVLTDAFEWGTDASDKRKSDIKNFSLSNNKGIFENTRDLNNLFVVGLSYAGGGGLSMLKRISKCMPERTYKLSLYNNSHATTNLDSQYYNVLLSCMGLSDTMSSEWDDTSFNFYGNVDGDYNFKTTLNFEQVTSEMIAFLVVSNDINSLNRLLGDFSLSLKSFEGVSENTASGNYLLDIETDLVKKVSQSIENLSSALTFEVGRISSVGENMQLVDEDLANSLETLFDDFKIGDNLNIPREEPIALMQDENHISTNIDDTQEQ